MSDFGGGGILGGLGGIVTGIASAIRSFFGITADTLLRFLNWLKDHLLELTRQIYQGLWKLARGVGRLVRAFARVLRDGVRKFVTTAWERFQKLEAWLKEKFAPVLKWLHELKQHVQDIYDKYVKPVVDTIEFIRQLNSFLKVFHIDLLSKLDSVLQQVEQRIEQPFDWVTKKISWLENWIDRIVTIDGLYRRAVLLSSMSRYAPSWISGFWNGQIDRDSIARKAGAIPIGPTPEPPSRPGDQLGRFYRGVDGDYADAVPALVALWREAAGVDPPGSTGV